MHHDGAVLGFLAQRYLAHDGHVCQTLHVRAVLYLVLQQVAQVDDAEGDAEAQDQGGQVINLLLRGHRVAVRKGFFDDAPVVRRRGQSDGVLLAFLEQHRVQGCLDLLLAGNAHEFLLLFRSLADTAFKLPGLAVEVLFRDLKTAQHARHRRLHAPAHRFQIGIELHYGGVLFRRGEQQAVALAQLGVVLVDGRAQALVLQTHIAGYHLIAV